MRTKPSRRRGGGLGAGAGSAARRIMGALLLMYLAMSAAAAQTWLAATDPGRSDLGPDIAKGAVIWSHGRALTAEDWQSPTPAYVAALRKGGWDTFRFNRWREGDTLPASASSRAPFSIRGSKCAGTEASRSWCLAPGTSERLR